MTTLVNLTPHPITIQSGDTSITIQPAGTVARVASTSTFLAETSIDGMSIPVYRDVYGDVTGLPDTPDHDTLYIVSGMVLAALAQQHNAATYDGWVVAPATGPNDNAVRDDQGRIIAVTRLKGM